MFRFILDNMLGNLKKTYSQGFCFFNFFVNNLKQLLGKHLERTVVYQATFMFF